MIEILLWTLLGSVIYGFVWLVLIMICGLLTDWEPRTLMVGCLLWPITFLPLLVISLGCWWGELTPRPRSKLRERMK